MSVGDLFWLFFIFTAIQPMLRQRMLEAMRTRKISQLETQRKSRVILLVHRQETMRLLGFPVMRYIDINDAEDVLRAIQMTDDDVPLDLVLHTPGGLGACGAADREGGSRPQVQGHGVRAPLRNVRRHIDRAGSRRDCHVQALRIGTNRSAGRISPAASLIKVVEEKPIARVNDETLVLADVGRKAISQLKQSASELLQRRLPAEQASVLAEKLTVGTWTHDYPIWASTARELGMPVSTDMPDDVLELMTLYPQPMRMQSGSGGVEYLPVPRQKKAVQREA
jgi:ClpP class serine protease